MSMKDRFKAILYIIDNEEVKAAKIKKLLKTYTPYLHAIGEANNMGFGVGGEKDDAMLEAAGKMLFKAHPKERVEAITIDEVKVEVKEFEPEEAEEKYNEFYLLL